MRLTVLSMTIMMLPGLAMAQGVVAELNAMDGSVSATLLPLSRLGVQIEMTDAAAQVRESRQYELHGSGQSLATVTFYRPLPVGASVDAAQVAGETWSGDVLGPEEADALRRQLALKVGDPVFLRDLGQAMYVARPIDLQLGGFQPGFTVDLTVSQALAPRGTMWGVSVPVDWHRQPAGVVEVSVSANTQGRLRTLYSPYHELTLSRQNGRHVTGSYVGYQRCTTFEVTILIATGDEPIRLDVLPHHDGKAGTFLALISPPDVAAEGATLGRDIALVIDRSGSMGGDKMQQAKAATQSVLSGLRPQDRFVLVAFDGIVETFKDEAVMADASEIANASLFVDDLMADGGTNIYESLKTAFASLPSQTTNSRYVIFLTDGQATAGPTDTEEILEMARSANEVGARVFPFGIGYDVNTILLDKLALESDGAATYIFPGQPVDVSVEHFFEQIADPILTNPVLDLTGIEGSQQYPGVLSDLFADGTIAVVGRYDQPGLGQIVIDGTQNGQAASFVFHVELPGYAVDEGFVPRVWARRRVGDILAQIKLGDTDPGLAKEAMAIARRYGVVTAFTFFQLSEDGDMTMTWSDVPVDAVGSKAVNTSASISSYQTGGTVDGTSDAWMRYHGDRTFPTAAGWFTDTSVTAAPEWVDLLFGSPAYFQLLEDERELGIAGYLGVGANVRFEFLGRHFRITDAGDSPVRPPPTESAEIPQGPTLPQLALTQIGYAWDGENSEVASTGGGQTPETAAGAIGGEPSSGCTAGGTSSPAWPAALIMLLLVAIRRRSA